jgi:hypothetical protein
MLSAVDETAEAFEERERPLAPGGRVPRLTGESQPRLQEI